MDHDPEVPTAGRPDDDRTVDSGTNVVVTGFMGTGKSTVGRALADALGYGFVDTDDVIESQHGSITTIFRDRGEAAFRTIEHEVAAELANLSRTVIATGGRLMLDPANVALLTGRVFCLVAEPDEILTRVTTDTGRVGRPLLAGDDARATIIGLLAERSDGYGRFEQVVTDGRSPEVIAAEIIDRIRGATTPIPNPTVPTPQAGDG